MENRNGYFSLIAKEDGMYLKIFEPVGNGKPVNIRELCDYLLKHDMEFDKPNLNRELTRNRGTFELKLSDNVIKPPNGEMVIFIDEEKIKSVARFFAPGGDGWDMRLDDIKTEIRLAGIKHGINEAIIEQFLKEKKYCTDYEIASATLPTPGKDAVIEYNFDTDLSRKPKTNEDGTVDFHTLNLMNRVEVGDLLATLTPADMGKPGMDIKGAIIPQPKVATKLLKYGKHIHISEDGLKIYSEVNGHVTLTEDRVFVSDTYQVPANVDVSTGDIEYKGNVEIVGNVNTGFSVKADGDIIVNGVVVGAFLTAGGSIILKRGIQGMKKGKLVAGANVISKFIESADISAGGYITTESIMHSVIQAQGDITVGGRRGYVTGGEVRSMTMISVKKAGSVMGTSTLLEVGVDPNMSKNMKELEKEMAGKRAESARIEQTLAALTRKMRGGEKLNSVKIAQFTQLANAKKVYDDRVEEIENKLIEINELLDNSVSGVILVEDTIYPGCKISISNVSTYVRSICQHCRYVKDGADIVMTAY